MNHKRDDKEIKVKCRGTRAFNTPEDKGKLFHNVQFIPRHKLLGVGQLLSNGCSICG